MFILSDYSSVLETSKDQITTNSAQYNLDKLAKYVEFLVPPNSRIEASETILALLQYKLHY